MSLRFGFVAVWNRDRLERAWRWAKANDCSRLTVLDAALAGQVEFAVLEPPGTRSLDALGAGDLPAVVVLDDRAGTGPDAWPRAAAAMRWAGSVVLLDGDHTPDRYQHAIQQAPIARRVLMVSTTPAAGQRWQRMRSDLTGRHCGGRGHDLG